MFSEFRSQPLTHRFWMIFGLFGALVFVAQSYFFKPSTMTVTGEGKLKVVPDQVSMVVTRVNSSADVARAVAEGEAGIRVLMDTTSNIVGGSVEMKKSFYQLQPAATADRTGFRYQVANAFLLTSKDVSKTNELIKSLYQDGATTVSNISFIAKDQEKSEQEARQLAVKAARKQAENIAKSTGKHLGRIVSVSDDNVDAQSTIGTQNMSATGAAFDQIEITKHFSVMYELW